MKYRQCHLKLLRSFLKKVSLFTHPIVIETEFHLLSIYTCIWTEYRYVQALETPLGSYIPVFSSVYTKFILTRETSVFLTILSSSTVK